VSNVSFADLGLSEPLLRALEAAKYTMPTPIQARTIPALLQGRDVLGVAQTGTGKTAAFALPVLQQLAASKERAQPKSPRALVLAPTRELAVQIARSFDTYGRGLGLRLCTVVGGLGYGRQIETLARASTSWSPRRAACSTWSSAEREVGQRHLPRPRRGRPHVRHGLHPRRASHRQLGLQAAPDAPVLRPPCRADVAKLASEILKNPSASRSRRRARAAPSTRSTSASIFVNSATKRALLSHLLSDVALERVIVFTRTKRGANRVAEALEDRGVSSEAIHATSRRTPARRRSTISAAARPACWSPPISPRAASMSTA